MNAMNAAACRYASSLSVAALLTACGGSQPPIGGREAKSDELVYVSLALADSNGNDYLRLFISRL